MRSVGDFTPLPQESASNYADQFASSYWEPMNIKGMPKSVLLPATEMDRRGALGVYNGADVTLAKIDEIEPGGEFKPAEYPSFSLAVSEFEAYVGSRLDLEQAGTDQTTELFVADRPLGFYIRAEGQGVNGTYTFAKVGHITMNSMFRPIAQRGDLRTQIYAGSTISDEEFDPMISSTQSLVHVDRNAALDMGLPKLAGWKVGPTYHRSRPGRHSLLRVRHTDVFPRQRVQGPGKRFVSVSKKVPESKPQLHR